MSKTFILNDESKTNSYGFRLRNARLNLGRFKSNPVMLASHKSGEILGKWTNVRIEGSQLLAEADFDTADPEAAKWAGKVERGFLSGASLGLWRDLMPLNLNAKGYLPEGEDPVYGGEVYEASIVSVPANAGALSVKLYSKEGVQLTDVQLSALTNPTVMNQEEKQNYEKQIAELSAENKELREHQQNALKEQIKAKLSAYEHLSKGQQKVLEQVGLTQGIDQMETLLQSMPAPTSLSAMTVHKGKKRPETYAELSAMGKETLDYYMKNEPEFVNNLIEKA